MHATTTKPMGADGECAECKRKKLGIQRMAAGDAPQTTAPPIVHQVLQQPGRPLDGATRNFMESRFGQDFGHVRVHTDGEAAESAEAVHAKAYTVGNNIVFGNRQYKPATSVGTHLLAHELTHVLQQGDRLPTSLQRAETDTVAFDCSKLKDSKTDVDDKVNGELNSARGKTDGSFGKIIPFFFEAIAKDAEIGRSAIEKWAETLGKDKINSPTVAGTKYAGVASNVSFTGEGKLWKQSFFPILNPSMKVNNVCIGSDKLGHFFQQWLQYYKVSVIDGKGDQKAVDDIGVATEAGGFGLQTTGVFSNADLSANLKGLQFYKDLAANPGMAFHISNYITGDWNEEQNPNLYAKPVAEVVWPNLLKGAWSGHFTINSHTQNPFTFDKFALSFSSKTEFTGSYEYTSKSNGTKVTGQISDGKLIHVFDSSQPAVKSVKLAFLWTEGNTARGKGVLRSNNESELVGTWGQGIDDTKGGTFKLSK